MNPRHLPRGLLFGRWWAKLLKGLPMNTYTMVTELILEKLSSGVIPWRKTWASGIPCSYGSGKEYRGINIILLGLLDFPSKYWITYKEALRLKGFVKKKGSKGSPIVYWHWKD